MLTLTLSLVLLAPAVQPVGPIEADVLLKGGTIHDGSGSPGIVGDLALKGDKIVAVGSFKVAGNPKVLDCTGLILAPGFIDLHTHSDNPLQKADTRSNLNYLLQGVTTAVTGNCGFGPEDVGKFFQTLEKGKVGSNVIHQVPHNAVRQKVMGNANRAPTEIELKAMEDLVDQGMKAGAYGLATGLIYNPGTYSKTDELVALSKVAAKHGGLYASHIRDEGTGILTAIEEILEIARKAGIRVHISHIKVSGRRAWGKAPEVLAMIHKAQKDGLVVTADQYPYTASSTSLTATVIPAKYREGSAKDLIQRLDDPELGPKIRKDIEKRLEDMLGGKTLRIAQFAAKPEYQGKDVATLAAQAKVAPVDLVLDILKKGGAAIVSFGMNDEEMRLFMREPFVATASDGSARVPNDDVPHPRSYGTFPRKIGRFAIEDKVISLEQAIRSASGLPADILKLPSRGYLKPGYFADVIVLNPKTYRDQATFDQPHQYATGVDFVFVNGDLTVDRGKYTGSLGGRVLRHQK